MDTTAAARIALVGDHNPAVLAHRGIPRALGLAREAEGVGCDWTWLHTLDAHR